MSSRMNIVMDRNKQVVNAFRVDYRKDGQNRAAILPTSTQANTFAKTLRGNKRKVIGVSPVTLAVRA